MSEESRKKSSIAKMGNKNPNFGKHLSEETKKKLSEAKSGEKNHNFGKKCPEHVKQATREYARQKKLLGRIA